MKVFILYDFSSLFDSWFLSCASTAQKNVIKKRIEQAKIRYGHYFNTLITQKTVKREKFTVNLSYQADDFDKLQPHQIAVNKPPT